MPSPSNPMGTHASVEGVIPTGGIVEPPVVGGPANRPPRGGHGGVKAPTNLSATAASSSQIDLSWTDNSPNETGFSIERSADGVSGWAEIDTNPADDTTYSDTGLDPSTEYFYRVRAYRNSKYSDYTNVASDTTNSAALFATGQFAVDFSTATTVDLTISGLGWTPKAAIFWYGGNTVLDTPQDFAVWSVGFTDGTISHCMTLLHNHNAATAAAGRYGNSNLVMAQLNSTGSASFTCAAEFSAFISDGVRINVTTTTASPRYVNVLFIGGDAQVKAELIAGPTALGTVSPSVGFEPNVVFLFNNLYSNVSATAGFASSAAHGTGIATWDGSTVRQCAYSYAQISLSNNGDPRAELINDGIMSQANGAGELQIGSFDADGFTLTETGGSNLSAQTVGYLAINTAGGQQWCGVVDMPTATGSKTFSEPNFQPSAGVLVSSMMTATGSSIVDTAGVYATSVFDGTRENCVAFANEDVADPNNTERGSSASAISVNADDGSAAFDATFTSFGATGPVFNFTAANGTTRKALLLVMGNS